MLKMLTAVAWNSRNFLIFLTFFIHIAAFSSSEPNPRWTGQNLASNLNDQKPKHVILIGASIGQAWRISSLPLRIDNFDYSFEYVHGGSSFDKND